MLTTALIFVSLAALLHVFIFYMESLAWLKPATRKTFGITQEQAEQTKEFAFNQGFYNLFLAITAGVGVAYAARGNLELGAALMFAGAGSMLLAALVLAGGSPDKRGAAFKQGFAPLVGLAALVVALFK